MTAPAPLSINLGHCLENDTGSHLEDADTTTPSIMDRNFSRQNPLDIIRSYRRIFPYHAKTNRLLQLKNRYSPDVFHSLVTDLQNANKKWHRMDCSDEISLDGHD